MVRAQTTHHSDGVLKSKSDLKDLTVKGFDLSPKFIELLLLTLLAGGVIVAAAVVR